MQILCVSRSPKSVFVWTNSCLFELQDEMIENCFFHFDSLGFGRRELEMDANTFSMSKTWLSVANLLTANFKIFFFVSVFWMD